MSRRGDAYHRSYRMGFQCWRCGARATATKTQTLSPTLMEAAYQCRNVNCGHTFVVALEAIRSLNPGAYPQPAGINVPLSPHIERRLLKEQLDLAPMAERGAVNPLPAVQRQMDLWAHRAGAPPAKPPGHPPDT